MIFFSLTLNSKLVAILESLGFVHLSVIHLKVLCDPVSSSNNGLENENETSNVLFQITSSLRNMLGSNKSKVISILFFSSMPHSPLIIHPWGPYPIRVLYVLALRKLASNALLFGVHSLSCSSRLLVLVVELRSRLLYDVMHSPTKCM